MDSWKDIELKRMLVGGNGKARSFFERHGCPPCNTDDLRTFIVAKYGCRAAKLYKEKIEAEANGQRFQEPAAAPASSSRGPSRGLARANSSGSRAKAADSWGDDDWGGDDWGSSSKKEPSRTPLARSASAGSVSVTQFTGKRTTSGGGAFAGLGGGTRQADGTSNQAGSRAAAANEAWDQLSGSSSSQTSSAHSRATTGGGSFTGSGAAATPAPAPQSSTAAARMSAAERAKAKYTAQARADSARIASLGSTSNSPRPASRGGSAAAKKDSWGDDDWEDDWGAASKPAARKPAARPAAKPAPRPAAAKVTPKPKLQPKKSVPGPDDDWDW
jgi:hypothetical protein